MKETKNVPQLRFSGFDDEWEVTLIEAILVDYNKKNIKDSNYPVLTSSRNGIERQEEHFGNVQQHDISDYNVIPSGYCTYRNRSDDTTFTFNINKTGETGIVSKFYPVFTFSNSNSYFITENLNNNEKLIKTIAMLAIGTGQKVLPHNEFKKICLLVPSCDEQKKIGSLLSNLDFLIQSKTKNLESLKAVKKSLLQKCFPKEGEKVPEMRFEGFSGDWDIKKFGDISLVFTDGDWIESSDQSDSGVRLIQTGNIGIGEFNDKSDKKKWISLETFYRLNCEEVFEGDILISRLPEPAGRACLVPHMNIRMITAVDCSIIRLRNNYDNLYIIQYLSSDMYFDIVRDFLAGGTRQRISRENLKCFDIPLPPTLAEQQKIGQFLSKYDSLIRSQQKEIDKLKDIKKSLLQKMFV